MDSYCALAYTTLSPRADTGTDPEANDRDYSKEDGEESTRDDLPHGVWLEDSAYDRVPLHADALKLRLQQDHINFDCSAETIAAV